MIEYFVKLKETLEQTNILNKEKEAIFELLGKTEKEIKKLNSKLERALKDKKTISKLLSRTSDDLERSSELIKKMFGRYLSTEVMNSLLEDPSALELGGEKRKVTIGLRKKKDIGHVLHTNFFKFRKSTTL